MKDRVIRTIIDLAFAVATSVLVTAIVYFIGGERYNLNGFLEDTEYVRIFILFFTIGQIACLLSFKNSAVWRRRIYSMIIGIPLGWLTLLGLFLLA